MPLRFLLAFALVVCANVGARAGDPLHARIDALIGAKAKADGVALSAAADDAAFARRAYLDFAGRIPTSEEAKAFRADTAADKRAKLLDRLLAAPEYATRMADLFHVVLMERLGDDPAWTKFLTESFARNAPWDAMVKKMLRADPKETAQPGAGLLARQNGSTTTARTRSTTPPSPATWAGCSSARTSSAASATTTCSSPITSSRTSRVCTRSSRTPTSPKGSWARRRRPSGRRSRRCSRWYRWPPSRRCRAR